MLTAVDRRQAFRYMGLHGAPSPQLLSLADVCEKALLSVIRPRYVHRIFPLVHREDGILCEAFPHSHFKFFSHRYHDLYFFDFYSLILSSGYELFEGKKPFFNSSQNPHFLLN